ncbi:hypothetical protein GCM10025771_02640 [Niveibacterium umoris]
MHLDAVCASLAALPGVELHVRDDSEGKLVVTVEDLPGHGTTETLTQVQLVPHLVCTTLAYEYADDATSDNPPDLSRASATPA